MSPRDLLRALTPLGWLLVGLAAVAALLALGWRWDPLDLQARRLEHAEIRAAVAESDAAARTLEAEGEVALRRQASARTETTAAAQAATAVTLNEARTADDASTPLDTGRADRLRRHDDELCRLAPRLDGCAAAPDDG